VTAAPVQGLAARHTLTFADLDPSALRKVLLRTCEAPAAYFTGRTPTGTRNAGALEFAP
jgi:hypothetical protein